MVSLVGDNLKRIQDAITAVSAQPESVKIIGVTKGQALERIAQGCAAGVLSLGNNYVQEGETLRAGLGFTEVEWHYIGQIQSRKVRQLGDYSLIQSVDRLEIASELSRRAVSRGVDCEILLEVNIAEEKGKAGVEATNVEPMLAQLAGLARLKCVGLMCLPPPLFPVPLRRPHMDAVAQIYFHNKARYSLAWLSMGTSDDYLEAIQAGANMVRLGTILYGSRS